MSMTDLNIFPFLPKPIFLPTQYRICSLNSVNIAFQVSDMNFQVTCPHCNITFQHAYALKLHTDAKHASKWCSTCKKNYFDDFWEHLHSQEHRQRPRKVTNEQPATQQSLQDIPKAESDLVGFVSDEEFLPSTTMKAPCNKTTARQHVLKNHALTFQEISTNVEKCMAETEFKRLVLILGIGNTLIYIAVSMI
jgi:hypothetical protein